MEVSFACLVLYFVLEQLLRPSRKSALLKVVLKDADLSTHSEGFDLIAD